MERRRKFVVGDTATAGDFVLTDALDRAKMANLLNQLPQLEAYMGQMCARPHASTPRRIAEALTRSGSGRETALQPDTTLPW